MKTLLNTLPVKWILSIVLISASLHAEDLQSLCNSLQGETVSSTPSAQSRPAEASGPSKPRKKKSQPSRPAATPPPAQARTMILGPKDKFPQHVSGMYVAGNFMPKFLHSDGLVLVAAEDFMNPFAREFIVANVSTGVAPGQSVLVENPHLIQITPDRPLIIVSRGIIPGSYIVNSQ